MEDEHSGPFWEERQQSLERAAENAAAEATAVPPVIGPIVPVPQQQIWTRESVLDFIRQHSNIRSAK